MEKWWVIKGVVMETVGKEKLTKHDKKCAGVESA